MLLEVLNRLTAVVHFADELLLYGLIQIPELVGLIRAMLSRMGWGLIAFVLAFSLLPMAATWATSADQVLRKTRLRC
jgi:hypothetical protein